MAATQKPWQSGWCSTGVHQWQHDRCRGFYERGDIHHECACEHHQGLGPFADNAQDAPDQATDVHTVYWVDGEGSAKSETGWQTREDADHFARFLVVHRFADIDSILVEEGVVSL